MRGTLGRGHAIHRVGGSDRKWPLFYLYDGHIRVAGKCR